MSIRTMNHRKRRPNYGRFLRAIDLIATITAHNITRRLFSLFGPGSYHDEMSKLKGGVLSDQEQQ